MLACICLGLGELVALGTYAVAGIVCAFLFKRPAARSRHCCGCQHVGTGPQQRKDNR